MASQWVSPPYAGVRNVPKKRPIETPDRARPMTRASVDPSVPEDGDGWRQPIRDRSDIEAIERRPYDAVVPVHTMHGLLQRAATLYPDRPALTYLPTGSAADIPEVLTFSELLSCVRKAANAFRRLGLRDGEAVALLLPTLPDTFMALLAAESCGRVCPINYMLAPDKIASLLHHANATILIALGPDPDLPVWEKVDAIRALSPSLRCVLSVGPEVADGVMRFADLVAQAPEQPEFHDGAGRDDVAAYFHTGGTTGSPKLVTQTHGNQVHASWFGGLFYGIGPDDVVVNGFPLFHVAGAFVLGGAAIAAGANTLIPSKLGMRSPNFVAEFWQIADRHEVTLISGGPTFVSTLLERAGERRGAQRIKALVGGGSAMPNELANRFEERFAIPLRSIYGMTELAGLVSIVPRAAPRVPGASGWPLPYSEVGVFRTKGGAGIDIDCRLADGETGGLAIRGPNISPGYSDPALNEGIFLADGWVVTGDLGHIGGDGQVFVTGRAKDVIIRGGHNIDPVGVEEALMCHPDVAYCAAVGQPDAHAGELPVAFVQPKAGTTPTPDEILDVTAHLIPERSAIPKRIYIVELLPLTTTGKVFRPALRLRAAEIAFDDQLRALLPDGALAKVTCTDTSQGQHVLISLSPGSAAARDIVSRHMARFSVTTDIEVADYQPSEASQSSTSSSFSSPKKGSPSIIM